MFQSHCDHTETAKIDKMTCKELCGSVHTAQKHTNTDSLVNLSVSASGCVNVNNFVRLFVFFSGTLVLYKESRTRLAQYRDSWRHLS